MNEIWLIRLQVNENAKPNEILRALYSQTGVIGAAVLSKAPQSESIYKAPKPGPDFY